MFAAPWTNGICAHPQTLIMDKRPKGGRSIDITRRKYLPATASRFQPVGKETRKVNIELISDRAIEILK